jgi:hypothetical protein
MVAGVYRHVRRGIGAVALALEAVALATEKSVKLGRVDFFYFTGFCAKQKR